MEDVAYPKQLSMMTELLQCPNVRRNVLQLIMLDKTEEGGEIREHASHQLIERATCSFWEECREAES